jgi:hypothetical protein
LASDPDALIQTGPGLPEWQWRSVQLRWNGPVDRTQQIRLWLISPAMNLALGLIRVAAAVSADRGLSGLAQLAPASACTGGQPLPH